MRLFYLILFIISCKIKIKGNCLPTVQVGLFALTTYLMPWLGSKRATRPFNRDESPKKLFFINLGGYKENEFEEFHYKMLVACQDKSVAIQRSKQSAFYKHTGFKGATSHIDYKYGVDVDDIFEIEDILTPQLKEKYGLMLAPSTNGVEGPLNMGYFKLEKL